jgi:hypothetical protein
MEDCLKWLQNWYKSQCDSDWEHEFGVIIDTVDNPGWYVVINLTGTECEAKPFSPIEYNMNDEDADDWYFCLLRNNNFEASGSPNRLFDSLNNFREWAEECKKINNAP